MLLGIVSDTHGNLEHTARAVTVLREHKIDVLIHCGDIGSPSVVQEFMEWPSHFVFGNVDHDAALLRQSIRNAGLTCHDRFGEIELDGKKIAVIHSDDARRFDEVIKSGQYDLVCYGHTHKPEFHDVGQTRVLNPGALHRANPHTLALVDIETLAVEHVNVDMRS